MNDLEANIQRLLDLEEIKMLKYKYCHYNDGGWSAQPVSHQGPSADLFTEDGVWDGRPVVMAEGREAIRNLFASFASLPMAYHAVTNPIIEIAGDTAKGHWHLIGGGIGLSNASSLGIGGYEDEYVRTPQGWRVRLMRVIWGRRTIVPNGWEEATPKVI
jgi:SnoaL-like domain